MHIFKIISHNIQLNDAYFMQEFGAIVQYGKSLFIALKTIIKSLQTLWSLLLCSFGNQLQENTQSSGFIEYLKDF